MFNFSILANSNSKESITASEYLSEHTADKPVAITTISVCTSNTSESITVASTTIKNKISTKIVPAVSNSTLNTSLKEQLENKDAHSQDVTSTFVF